MIMPEADYTRISTDGEEYTFPTKPAIPSYSSRDSKRDKQRARYKSELQEYQDARALRNQLKAQLIQAIPSSYRAVLAHPVLGYANVTPRAILTHMLDRYGRITEQDLQRNLKALETPWDPETTIDTVFINGTACREFAVEGGDPITDKTYIRALVTIFHNCGVMEDAIKEWQKLDYEFKTVENAVTHFTNADAYRRETQKYLKGTLAANLVTPAPVPAAPPAAALLTGPAPGQPPRNCRGLQGYGYCWTHGVVQHDGNTCRSPREGHIKEATLSNPQGGRLHIGKNKASKKKRKTPGPDPADEPTR
jgi:hypothetical protein